MDERMKLNLQLFAEGGDGGAPAAAASTGETQAAAAPENQGAKKGLAGVIYGKQPAEEAQAPDAPAQTEPTPEDLQSEWNELRNGKFKSFFDADTQNIVKNRLKNSKAAEQTLESLNPLLEILAQKYGTKAGDTEALLNKLRDDDSLYEEEALEKGIPVETLKQLKNLQRDNEQMRARQQQSLEESLFQQHIQGLVQQGEQVKQVFPSFDLRKELQNDTFRRLTSPEGGVDVMTAYRVVHAREIEPMAMQVASQKTAEMLSQKIQAGKSFPRENGVGSTAGVEVRSDPSKLTKADFDEIRERARRGEKIEF